MMAAARPKREGAEEMHFMDAVAAEQRDDREQAEREPDTYKLVREPVSRRLADRANLEAWMFASCGFRS